MKVDVGAFAAEFPNDNPALHRGALWVCRDVTGAPVLELPARMERPKLASSLLPAAIIEARGPAPALPIETEVALAETAAAVARAAEQLARMLDAEPEPEPAVEAPPIDEAAERAAREEADAITALVVEAVHEALAEAKRLEELRPVESAHADVITRMVVDAVTDAMAIVEAETDKAEAMAREEDEARAKAEEEAVPVTDEPDPLAEQREERPSGIMLVGERTATAEDLESDLVVEELEPLDASMEIEIVAHRGDVEHSPISAAAETILPPPPADPFTQFLTTLADIAIAEGSPFVASTVSALFADGLAPSGLPGDAVASLSGAGILVDGAVSEGFVATTRAWRDIIRGTSEDFSACGAMMLDEWAADVLARLLGAAEREPTLRRELRSRGVAAFGLVEAA